MYDTPSVHLVYFFRVEGSTIGFSSKCYGCNEILMGCSYSVKYWYHSGDVLVLHTPIIKYIFEIYLGIICIAGGKNRKENMEGLKTVQLSTVVVTLLYSTLLDNLTIYLFNLLQVI